MAQSYTKEDFEELKRHYATASEIEETYEYILLPDLKISDGSTVDALLCPQNREGYKSRLFFSKKVPLKEEKPWNQFYIDDKTWYVYSWQTPDGLTLVQMLGSHLKALKQ